jgi:hypothetical protein
MMLWIAATDDQVARLQGERAIQGRGWILPRILRGRQVHDTDLIDDDVLRQAAETALTDGVSLSSMQMR